MFQTDESGRFFGSPIQLPPGMLFRFIHRLTWTLYLRESYREKWDTFDEFASDFFYFMLTKWAAVANKDGGPLESYCTFGSLVAFLYMNASLAHAGLDRQSALSALSSKPTDDQVEILLEVSNLSPEDSRFAEKLKFIIDGDDDDRRHS